MFEKNQAIKLLIDAETGAIVDANPAACKFYGYRRDEFKTKKITDINALPKKQVEREMRQAKNEKRNYFVFPHRLSNGEIRDVEIHSSLLSVQNQNLLYSIIHDITNRKRAEESLRESENQYRNVFENANDLIYVHDLEGNYISINQASEKLFGYTREEAMQMNLAQIAAPDHMEFARRMLLKKIAGTKQTAYEVDCITKDGSRVTLEVNSSTIYKNGKPIAVQGIARDITKRKRDEKTLKTSEEQYRDLFENANDLIYTHDLKGNFTSLNRAGELITGYSRTEALKINISQVVAPDFMETARRMTARKIDGEIPTPYELVIIAKDGHRVSLELSTRLIFQNNIPIGVQGIGRDITERKRSEETLKKETALVELLQVVAVAANEAANLEDAAKFCLDKVCALTKWQIGHLNLLAKDSSHELVSKNLWYVNDRERFEKFICETEKTRWSKGIGLPGRVLENGKAVWCTDVIKESNFLRTETAKNVGIKSASAFPILAQAKVIGVLEFFSTEKAEPDEKLMEVMMSIGTQLGQVIERKQAEDALRLSERRYRFLSEGIMHQVWTATPDGKLDYINSRAREYFGRTSVQMLEEGWLNAVHPDDLPECVERWKNSLFTGEYYEVECRLRRSDGIYRWHLARATAGRDNKGEIINWFGTNTDIDDKRMAEEKLNHFALHDALTNLPNRTEFINHLELAIKRAAADAEFRFAVLFLDLDRFKVINDSLGHLIGDKLLIGIAQRLKSCVRPGDIVARLGGDEFTILLNKTGGEIEVAKVAERLQAKLSKPFIFNNYEVFTSASIGVILSDGDHAQPEEYLRDADAAMYRAKETGKARYEIFDSEMHVRNIDLLQLETDLRYAVERNEFEVFYQPIVCLDTGEICELEALIRWRHPTRGLIAPSEFISIAEETGLIIQIGQWILSESCRQTAIWHNRFPALASLSVSVNLSAKQLMHPSLTSQVQKILQRSGLSPRHLKLEVTESTVMENSEIALGVLSELHLLDVSLSTDDFGTGYSSLSYLHRFPFQRMKIDRSFINRMDTDIKSEAIVRSILMLGQNLEIETVAEGIENKEQLWQLRSLGCQFGQGYLFSPPVGVVAAEKLLHEGLSFSFDSVEAPFSFADTKRRLIELDKIQ
jgi:diguanylate cyclase (GGDEF)-like protein/PAS domain S-box-containing protein